MYLRIESTLVHAVATFVISYTMAAKYSLPRSPMFANKHYLCGQI